MKGKPVILLGAGGHAKVLLDILLEQDADIIGILDNGDLGKGNDVYGVSVLGSDEEIKKYHPDKVELVNGLGSASSTELRRRIYEKFKAEGYLFRKVIHPGAHVSRRACLMEGVQVMAGAVINIGAQVGENAIINTKASIDHDCRIGAHVHIAPGCTLSGNVVVEEGCHIGTGASVIQGVHIGARALVGAGSVVISNVMHGAAVCGVPVRMMEERSTS